MYLYLLIFCGIWSHGIIPTFGDADNKDSSDFLVRQKRVVSYEHGGADVVRIEQQPYVVLIKRYSQLYCVGTILSQRVVITAAECAEFNPTEYKIVSKSALTNRGTAHNVTHIEMHYSYLQNRPLDGIALLTVNPVFVYGTFVRNIELHAGPIMGPIVPGMVGTVSGWGYNCNNRNFGPGTIYTTHLRTIQVPIISHNDCVERYRNHYPITNKDICTFHPLRNCGHTDGGAPLVIDNLLVGIFLRSGPLHNRYDPEYPEVFALLPHTDYNNWIRANI